MIATADETIRTQRDGSPLTEVTVDPGTGANLTADLAAGAGVDSPPLPGDYLVLVPIGRTGGVVAVGGADPLNAGVAEPGEHRLYSRNAAGVIMATVWIKGDGAVNIMNLAGAGFVISPTGDITLIHPSGAAIGLDSSGNATINGVVIDNTGVIRAANIIVGPNGATVNLLTHLHTSTVPTTPTSPPIVPS